MSKKFLMMEPKNETFNELMEGSNKYFVPRFQRDYAWNKEQWDDLWADINALDSQDFHYMGYIVLQQTGQNQFEVIDGQQRIVTMTIIVLAAMKVLSDISDKKEDNEHNKHRLDGLFKCFIHYKDWVSLETFNKLELNRNNNEYFEMICSELAVPKKAAMTSTNDRLRQCFNFFCEKHFGDNGREIVEFINHFSKSVIFTKIMVQDTFNAYKLFETLNARGVQLSTPDLLKNFIFSTITKDTDFTDQQLDEYDRAWSSMMEYIAEDRMHVFMRYHYNSQQKLVSEKELFPSLAKTISTSNQAREYLQELIEFSPVYAALINPNNGWWDDQEFTYKEVKTYLLGMRRFNIMRPIVIFLAAFKQFSAEEFVKTVKYFYILSIRCIIIGNVFTSDHEKIFNEFATKISNKMYTKSSDIVDDDKFIKLYPDDNDFFEAFKTKTLPYKQTKKKIQFLLTEIENYLGITCEHEQTWLKFVIPEKISDYRSNEFGDKAKDMIGRLGNMLILNEGGYKLLTFEEQKVKYRESGFKIAQNIASYDTWDVDALNSHQTWLAKHAVNTWKV